MNPGEKEIENYIEQIFEENFKFFNEEYGHSINPYMKRQAKNQVIFYWKKLKSLAEEVTDTEVRLSLPGQKTKKGRMFTIEGVVDVVREQDNTAIYDIKTQDIDYIKNNKDEFKKQLNVYAHIWQKLRQLKVDKMAIIATRLTEELRLAMKPDGKTGIINETRLQQELEKWDPILPIEFDQHEIDETIHEFAEVVDAIEEREYKPKTYDELIDNFKGTKSRFATAVCRNCDARFSCDSYRTYAWDSTSKTENDFKKYINTHGTDEEHEELIDLGLTNYKEE